MHIINTPSHPMPETLSIQFFTPRGLETEMFNRCVILRGPARVNSDKQHDPIKERLSSTRGNVVWKIIKWLSTLVFPE